MDRSHQAELVRGSAAHTSFRRSERGGVFYKLLALAFVAGLLFLLFLAREPLLRGFIGWWIVDEAPQEAQAVVVLGGDSVFGDRIRHGVDLYRQGWAPRLIVSGYAIRSYFSETELMEREATELGVPSEALLVFKHNARSTQEEALALRRFLAERQIRDVIVVTSNFHTRRTRWIFRKVFRGTGVQVKVSASSDVRVDPRRWWKRRSSMNYVLLELLKTLNSFWELRDVAAPAPGTRPPEPAPSSVPEPSSSSP